MSMGASITFPSSEMVCGSFTAVSELSESGTVIRD